MRTSIPIILFWPKTCVIPNCFRLDDKLQQRIPSSEESAKHVGTKLVPRFWGILGTEDVKRMWSIWLNPLTIMQHEEKGPEENIFHGWVFWSYFIFLGDQSDRVLLFTGMKMNLNNRHRIWSYFIGQDRIPKKNPRKYHIMRNTKSIIIVFQLEYICIKKNSSTHTIWATDSFPLGFQSNDSLIVLTQTTIISRDFIVLYGVLRLWCWATEHLSPLSCYGRHSSISPSTRPLDFPIVPYKWRRDVL